MSGFFKLTSNTLIIASCYSIIVAIMLALDTITDFYFAEGH